MKNEVLLTVTVSVEKYRPSMIAQALSSEDTGYSAEVEQHGMIRLGRSLALEITLL